MGLQPDMSQIPGKPILLGRFIEKFRQFFLVAQGGFQQEWVSHFEKKSQYIYDYGDILSPLPEL